ncbi:uncharacterized protein KD926_007171, partial [Aspergillus affinis]|uniref:uncharacterized protein n=1 Tax=Aspergillus affinis TaxID=1070780 RepID=UPI0022FEE643
LSVRGSDQGSGQEIDKDTDEGTYQDAGKEFSVAEPELLSDEQPPHATVEESTREMPDEPAFHPHPQTPVLEITTVPKAGPVVPLDRVEPTPPTANPARTDGIVSFSSVFILSFRSLPVF